jgi:hypothetical protein
METLPTTLKGFLLGKSMKSYPKVDEMTLLDLERMFGIIKLYGKSLLPTPLRNTPIEWQSERWCNSIDGIGRKANE